MHGLIARENRAHERDGPTSWHDFSISLFNKNVSLTTTRVFFK